MATATATAPASERSASYLLDLAVKRDVMPGTAAADARRATAQWLAKSPAQKAVSDAIDRALKAPLRPKEPAAPAAGPAPTAEPLAPVPEAVPVNAKFALRTGSLKTFRDTPWAKTNKHLFLETKERKGERLISRLQGSPGRYNRLTLRGAQRAEVLEVLSREADAFEAMILYGEVWECCGRCGAELTVTSSLDNRFGPVCFDIIEEWKTLHAALAARAADGA